MKIWLIRHGETKTGPDGLYRSHHGLTDLGIQQADEVAQVLAEHKIDICYSSGLVRAIETMQRYIKIVKHDVNTVHIDALNEIDIGRIEEAPPEIKKQIISHQSDLDFSQFGGENPKRFQRRVVRGWQELLEDAKAKKVSTAAAFLHGGTIGAIIDHIAGNQFKYRARPRMPNCAYTIIDTSFTNSDTRQWNEWQTSHLSNLT